MTFYSRNYRFAPKWYFVIATLLLCALFVRLGFWQLARAEVKQQLQQTFEAHLHKAPEQLDQLPKNTDLHYYPVKVTGHYDNANNILLDNKLHAHQVGYEVLTPFIPDNNQQVILVNRGWVLANTDRRVLPTIPAITPKQTITGHLYIPSEKSFTLGTSSKEKTSPLRVQTLDIPFLQTQLNKQLYPFILLLSPELKGDFVRDWQPVVVSASKHVGYAVQWFAFATVLVIIFFALSIRRRNKK